MNALEKTSREERNQQRRRTPSFSSSLLDSIYRSIDESNGEDEPKLVIRKQKQSSTRAFHQENYVEEIPNLRRAIMIEKWTENRSNSTQNFTHFNLNSNSSSSDSSRAGGGMFSSSETESGFRSNSTPKSSIFTMQRLKQARTGVSARSERSETATESEEIQKCEGRFMRTTKSKALKIYGDLKKVKQPISPGGRIASFLNSIFSSRNLKKPKIGEAIEELSSVRKSRAAKDLTNCSPAASFSRPCLSKAPSTRGNGMKRSVRFYPSSVIVDEDCRPCGHKSIYEDDPSLMPNVKNHSARDRFRGYQSKSTNNYVFKEFHEDYKDVDEDDVESCSSSDLFELENIGAVGSGVYREELPVYGTTSLRTNRAIANGLITTSTFVH